MYEQPSRAANRVFAADVNRTRIPIDKFSKVFFVHEFVIGKMQILCELHD